MLYYNANVFVDGKFVHGGFRVERGRFTEVFAGETKETGTDLQGAYVIPGLVDAHIHGYAGADFSDGDYEGLVRMARGLAKCGVTSFAPASMTLPYEQIELALSTAVLLRREHPEGCAWIAGTNMEGPFFSEKKKGAQNGAYLKKPDFEAFRSLYDFMGGIIGIVDIAPELEGAEEFIRKAKDLCTVSVAHTACNYEEAVMAYEAGATHLTHLFNAMPSIHHREPAAIGAASERDNVLAELICDGFHVHPSAVRMAFKLFPGRICLISDALRCCGMPEGEYELGGQPVYYRGGAAKLADGTIAGAVTDLFACLQNAVKFGISKEEAILSATLNPARQLGVEYEVGSIAKNKRADFIICDENLHRKQVFLEGKPIA